MNPNEKQEQERYDLLVKCVPDLFKRGGTCLYIGASVTRFQMGQRLIDAGYEISIVEPWQPNIMHYRARGFPVVADDIRNAVLYLRKFDIVMWWHGPEHVNARDLTWLVPTLETLARRYVILAYPYGEYLQGSHGGNDYEKHVTTLWPDSFRGYQSASIGNAGDGPQSCVIAWKRI